MADEVDMAVGQLVNDVQKMAAGDDGGDYEEEEGGLEGEGEDEEQEDEVIERRTGGRTTRFHGACDIPLRPSHMHRISHRVFLAAVARHLLGQISKQVECLHSHFESRLR